MVPGKRLLQYLEETMMAQLLDRFPWSEQLDNWRLDRRHVLINSIAVFHLQKQDRVVQDQSAFRFKHS